jgi:AhpD family alkylhydroperoxidase
MDQTLIPKAIKAGAVLRELCEVQTVEPVAGGYEVRFHDARQGRTAVLRAPRVVMSAGTMNTLRILLRSTVDGGLGGIPNLGKHFSLGGDNLALYRLPRDIGTKKMEGHFLDAVMAVPGAKGFDHQSMAFAPPFLGGSRLLRSIQGQRTLTLFGFGPDEMDGEVSWKRRALVVRHQPQSVVARIRSTQDRIAQEFGRTKAPRSSEGKRARPWFSCHPIGGCRMATDASRGVVDFKGKVFGHPGLHAGRRLGVSDDDDRGTAAQCLSSRVLDLRTNRQGRGLTMTRAERFTKRTFTLPLLARSLGAVVWNLPVLAMALVRPSVPRALREQVMLGVNSVNGCRYCSWAHTGRALAHGVNLDELVDLLDTGTLGKLDERDATAILFAQNFADTIRQPTPEAHAALANRFTASERRELTAYIHAIYLGSLCGNSADAWPAALGPNGR